MAHSTKRQPQWNIYEAAILLDGYLEVKNKNISRSKIIENVSKKLRQMAINQGIEIDDIYRNRNGISYQIQSMDSAFQGHKIYVPATKLFKETVRMYREEQVKYEEILRKARYMIAAKHDNATNKSFEEDVVPSQFVAENKIGIDIFSPKLLEVAESIIAIHFPNGMRKNSNIAKKKFRMKYVEMTGEEIKDEIDIDKLVASIGYEYDNKIYTVSIESKTTIKVLIKAAMEQGNKVIFYQEFYRQNLSLMTKAGIYSAELLKNVLKDILPGLYYGRLSFAPSRMDCLENDIVACFDDDFILTYSEMKNRLKYADMEQIKIACSRDYRFVWIKEETYALTEKLELSTLDIEETKKVIENDIASQGFSVMQRICVSKSIEMNSNISKSALRYAIYNLHFAEKYERKGTIITLPGFSFSASKVMEDYCMGIQEVMLEELMAYEKELTDKTRYSLSVAYETMLRVDKDYFVGVDTVNFDIQAVDNAIALFVQDNIIPLKSVTSFTSFPETEGLAWNLFLLDSYCKHKSIRFHSMGGPAKSKPVGAIYPSTMRFSNYDDLLVQVVAKDKIKLEADIINTFLTANAYTLRKIDTREIIKKVQEIRIRED
jgi:hypothetical protein